VQRAKPNSIFAISVHENFESKIIFNAL